MIQLALWRPNDFSERHLSRCLVAGSMDVEVGRKEVEKGWESAIHEVNVAITGPV